MNYFLNVVNFQTNKLKNLKTKRSDLNESFMSRNRHMVQNKPIHNQNSFLIDVFDLLELDIEDYINTVNKIRPLLPQHPMLDLILNTYITLG